MEQWIGSVAVVTGASAGIGAAIVRNLVKAGVVVVGLARRLNRLEELGKELSQEKGTFHPKQCDVTNEERVLKIFRWIEETLGPVSILINNATVIIPTTMTAGNTDAWRSSFDINVLAVCICTREAIQQMKRHGIVGHIVNMSSLGGHFVPNIPTTGPQLSVYPAAKHALDSLTKTLRQELNNTKSKIKVSCISPGITESEIYNHFSAEVLEPMAFAPKLKAEDVAKAVIYILGTPPEVQVQDLLIGAVGEQV